MRYVFEPEIELLARLTDPYYHRAAEVNHLLGDSSKARQKIGWKPTMGFKDLMRLMVEHDLDLAEREAHAAKFSRKVS